MKKLSKRAAALIAALVMCLLAVSCSSADSGEWNSTATAYDVLERMITSANEYEARDDAEYLEGGLIYRADSDEEGKYLTDSQKSYYYGSVGGDPDFSCVTDYALWTAADSVSTELGVFVVNDGDAADTVKDFVKERINTLRQNALDYKPEEREKADKALITVKGKYVIYIVTNINDELEAMAEDEILEKIAESES